MARPLVLQTPPDGAPPLLAGPELEPEGWDDEAPAPLPADALERALAGAGTLREALLELEEASKWLPEQHPRWPKGTPGGLGGQFMKAGQRFRVGGVEYDVDQVLPGGVYAHLATKGKAKLAKYVWIPAAKKKGGQYELPGVDRPKPEAVFGSKYPQKELEKYNPTIADPYVQDDHDPSLPIPANAPKEMTPERWARFGRADQTRYIDVMLEFGEWSPGKAQGFVNSALAAQDSTIVNLVKAGYSTQYGSATGFAVSLQNIWKTVIGSKDEAKLEAVRQQYEEAKFVQDAAARAIQWDLYNRVKSPDIVTFHKSPDSVNFWKQTVLSGLAPAYAGMSQTQYYKTNGFGHIGVATPLTVRNIVLATTSANLVHHSFMDEYGEQEVASAEPLRLDDRSLVFSDGAYGQSVSTWLHKITHKGVDGTVLQALKDHAEHGAELPVPPEPAMIVTIGQGGQQAWVPPPPAAKTSIGKLGYEHVDANGAPMPKPANQLQLHPGDYIEGMQGTRYIIVEDKTNPFGIRYYKVTDEGAGQPDGSFANHTDFLGEECYDFEGQGIKPFKKLKGHFVLPTAAKVKGTGFVKQAWSEVANDQAKQIKNLEPGTKFVEGGVPYEILAKLGGGQAHIKNLDTGGEAKINDSYKTPWLVLKAGYTEEGVPVFEPGDYFQHPPGLIGELGLKEGDVILAGKTGDAAWQVKSVSGQGLEAVGLSAANQGKAHMLQLDQNVRLLEPKPPGWQPPQVGDTLAIDGKKGAVTKILQGGVVQVNLRPGVVKLKPDDWRLAGLFRPEAHEIGDEKVKLRDLAVGDKFHGGTGGKVRPYLVLEKDVDLGKGKPKGVRVRNLDDGQDSTLSGIKSYKRLVPKVVDAPPEKGTPKITPVDHGEVFDPNAWKAGAETAVHDLEVGDIFTTGTGYYKITADKGAAWEVKDLLTGGTGPQFNPASSTRRWSRPGSGWRRASTRRVHGRRGRRRCPS